MTTFKYQIKVTQADLDELRHVNNVRYLQWVQDVAEAHWLLKAAPEWKEKFI
jgi:acyl-CoA thioester hydrolase